MTLLQCGVRAVGSPPPPPAGWDARELGLPEEWVDISQPKGAGESITFGSGASLVAASKSTTEGKVEFQETSCEGRGCHFLRGLSVKGTMEPGSSGSGLLCAETRRVLGVLSAGGGPQCNFNGSSKGEFFFGRLASVSRRALSVSPRSWGLASEPKGCH